MKKFGIILFGLGLLVAQPLAAQNLAPALPDQGEARYMYLNPGQFVIASFGGYYVGPYEANLLAIGATPTNAAFSVYCVDFLHSTLPQKVVTADISNLGGGNTSLSRLGAGGLVAYKQAAFLSSLFHTYSTISQFSGLSQTQAWSGIHAAIWSLTTAAGKFTTDPNYSAFVTYAGNNYGQYNGYGQWSVLTTKAVQNNPAWDSQEFLVRTAGDPEVLDGPPSVSDLPPTVTPEPQTYLLMGSGLIFLFFVGRRRMKEMGYA